MKKFKLNLLAISVLACAVYFSGCSKKNEPAPSNNNNTTTHTHGSTEGTVTVGSTTTSTLQGSEYTSYGYLVNATNQAANPVTHIVSGYPALNISFSGRPTKDSIYTINSNNYISLDTAGSNNYTDHFSNFSSGVMTVDVTGTQYNVSFSSLTFTNSASGSIVASGSVTVY
jgi:hypothetical protein